VETPIRRNSFLEGLSGAVQGVTGALETIATNKERAYIQQGREVENAFAEETWRAQTDPVGGFSPGDSSSAVSLLPGLQGDVTKEIEGLDRVRLGVEQGRITPDLLSIRLNSAREKLFSRFPEYKGAIADMFNKSGYDDIILRDLRMSQMRADAEEKGDMTRDEGVKATAVDYLTKRGFNTLNMTTDEIMGTYIPLSQQDYKADQELAALERAQANANATGEAGKAAEKEAEETYLGSVINSRNTSLGVLFDIGTSLAQPGLDITSATEIASLSVNFNQALTQAQLQDEAAARAEGMSEESIGKIRANFDLWRKRFSEDIFNANFDANRRAFDNMKVMAGTQKYKALPIYLAYVDAFGQAITNELFGSPTMTDAQRSAVTKEFQAFDPSKPETMFNLVNASRVLRGEANIEDYTQRDGAKLLSTITPALVAQQRLAISGNLTYEDTRKFYNGTLQTQNALSSLTADAASPSQMWNGSQLGYSRDLRAAAEKIGGPEGQEMILGGRDAAATNIRALMQMRPKFEKVGFYSIVEAGPGNPNGPWRIQFDQKRWDEIEKRRNPNGVSMPLADPPAPPSKEMQAWVNTANRAAIFLQETAKPGKDYDEKLTPGQVRQMYGKGLPPPSPRAAETSPKAQQSREQVVQRFRDEIIKYGTSASEGRTEYPAWPAEDPRWVLATVFGENTKATPEEKLAIAATIINRAKSRGMTYRDVVTQSGKNKKGQMVWQYDVWRPGYALRDRMETLSGDEYEELMRTIEPLLRGEVPEDLRGVTNFYHPGGMPNGSRPDWDDGTGVRIGQGLFFRK
jgi:hypothetical protein